MRGLRLLAATVGRTPDVSTWSWATVTATSPLRVKLDGESTALEVVDAQNVLVQARNAYDDAQVRYRVALAELQTLTGRMP